MADDPSNPPVTRQTLENLRDAAVNAVETVASTRDGILDEWYDYVESPQERGIPPHGAHLRTFARGLCELIERFMGSEAFSWGCDRTIPSGVVDIIEVATADELHVRNIGSACTTTYLAAAPSVVMQFFDIYDDDNALTNGDHRVAKMDPRQVGLSEWFPVFVGFIQRLRDFRKRVDLERLKNEIRIECARAIATLPPDAGTPSSATGNTEVTAATLNGIPDQPAAQPGREPSKSEQPQVAPSASFTKPMPLKHWAETFSVSENTISDWFQNRQVKAKKIGRSWAVDVSELPADYKSPK